MRGGGVVLRGGVRGGVDSVEEVGDLLAKAWAAAAERVVSRTGTVGFRDSLEWLCFWVTWQLESDVS
jgi:hypothetical protein